MFTGNELLRIYEAARPNGLSQRKMATLLGEPFDAMHGKLFRAQKRPTQESTLTIEYPRIMLKPAVFDIECMDFAAGGVRDHLVCACILPLDSDTPRTISITFEDSRDDKRLLQEVIDALCEYDILIGHNVTAFDMNWLTTRLTYHNIPTPDRLWLMYDTYQASRRMALKADRKSLGFLGDFFRIDAVKTSVMPVSWGMVDSNNRNEFDKALSDIVYHCEQDVLGNRKLFDALWPRDKTMQNMPVFKRMG